MSERAIAVASALVSATTVAVVLFLLTNVTFSLSPSCVLWCSFGSAGFLGVLCVATALAQPRQLVAAARKAEQLRRKLGLMWDDLIGK
jgi:hypothetical protein